MSAVGLRFLEDLVSSLRVRRSALRPFLKDRSGTSAIEMAFSLPILLMVLTGIIQFGAMFFLQNHMGDVARDTARRLSVGQINLSQAQSYAEGELMNWDATFAVDVQELDDEVTVDITVPLAEASLVDILGLFESGTLRARAEMPKE